MGPKWGPTGSCRPQMGPMLAPWTLLSGETCNAATNLSRTRECEVGRLLDNGCLISCRLRIPYKLSECLPQTFISIPHYNNVIMSAMASQITSLTIVCSTVYSGADQKKHQSSPSLAFVRGIHRWPVISQHTGPVTRKMFPFDDLIMCVLLTTHEAFTDSLSGIFEAVLINWCSVPRGQVSSHKSYYILAKPRDTRVKRRKECRQHVASNNIMRTVFEVSAPPPPPLPS